MRNRILFFLVVGALTVMVFIFFFLQTQPLKKPVSKQTVGTSLDVKKPMITFVDPILGEKNARVTIVEYSDFACVACKQLKPVLDVVLKSYPNDVRIAWKDVPNDSAHPQATPSAVAAHCAANQNAFWKYADALFERQSVLSDDAYQQIADELKLNGEVFSTCFTKKATLPIVQKNAQEGLALGIVATPTLFIGERSFVGVPAVDELLKAVQEELATQNTQTLPPSN